MMTRQWFEKIAVGLSAAIIGGWLVFWVIQILGVIELLRLAYGW